MKKIYLIIPFIFLLGCKAEEEIINPPGPCKDLPSLLYEGKLYNTVQIDKQCWLKENLDAGTMIPGDKAPADNKIIEKYCYDNEPDSCEKYGGLYQWDEVKGYDLQNGTRGICPQGWHLPTDEEWKVLEGEVDGLYGIGEQAWDEMDWRGSDAGSNLKATSGWNNEGNGTDLFSFSGLPGGFCDDGHHFSSGGNAGYWWTGEGSTTHAGWAWYRKIGSSEAGIFRNDNFPHNVSCSVRCVRDE